MEKLEQELLELIIKICNLPDIIIAEINPDGPLIGPDSALGIDSLDAVEIVVAVQKNYNVRIANEKTSREVLATLSTLADFIRKNHKQ